MSRNQGFTGSGGKEDYGVTVSAYSCDPLLIGTQAQIGARHSLINWFRGLRTRLNGVGALKNVRSDTTRGDTMGERSDKVTLWEYLGPTLG